MKKFIFGILSVICVCLVMDTNCAWALNEPDCAAGTCLDAIYNGDGAFMYCNEGGGSGESCTCFENRSWTSYPCICTSDADCGTYCINGECRCRDCNCPDQETTSIDDCNYKTTTYNGCECDGTCINTTTFGCYTNGSDSTGDFSCVAD